MKTARTNSTFANNDTQAKAYVDKRAISDLFAPYDLKHEFHKIFNDLIGKYLDNSLIYRYESINKRGHDA